MKVRRRSRESWWKRSANRREQSNQYFQVLCNIGGFLRKMQASRTGQNIGEDVIFVPTCRGEAQRTLRLKGFVIENKTISHR